MERRSAMDVQVGGEHYKYAAMQPAEFWLRNQLPATEGAVVKYIWRYPRKDGIRDLQKARHFVEMMIEAYYGERPWAKPRMNAHFAAWEVSPEAYCELNALSESQTRIIGRVCRAASRKDLQLAVTEINELIDKEHKRLSEYEAANVTGDPLMRAHQALYVAINRLESVRNLVAESTEGNPAYREAQCERIDETVRLLREEARS